MEALAIPDGIWILIPRNLEDNCIPASTPFLSE